MRIAMISDVESWGGAAQATSRLAAALSASHEVLRIVQDADGEAHPWQSRRLDAESELRRRLLRVPRRLFPARFPQTYAPESVLPNLRRALSAFRPDVVHLHNLHGAPHWPPALAGVAARFAPVVWTLHDMWSFTGRCAYTYDCRKFVDGCDAECPTPEEYPPLAPTRIAAAWRARFELFAATRLTAVTPSAWLAREAQQGLWRDQRVEVIANGIPVDSFAVTPRAEARAALGMSRAGAVVLVAAQDLSERRKGAAILPQVWQSLDLSRFTVLAMGGGTLPAPPHLAIHRLGRVDDQRTKALAFAAADVLLHPAPVDNFPNVVLEAFASGTPVVASPIGGLPEMVRHGISGWLAPTADAAGLASALTTALAAIAHGDDLRTSCRRLAEAEFGLALHRDRHLELYRSLQAAAGVRR